MSENHPTAPAAPVKPAKPYPDFPLFPHAAGVWAKKIRGKMHYFGPWADPDGALKKYLEQKDDLHAGRKSRPDPQALMVKELCKQFLHGKRALVDAAELAALTWGDYKTACDEIVAAFGKTRLVSDLGPDDFAALRNGMAKKWGHHRLSKTIQFVRCVFKHAYDAGLIDRPIRFGPEFKRPSKKTIRLHWAKQGPPGQQASPAAGRPAGAKMIGPHPTRCQRCSSARLARVLAHCSDMCSVDLAGRHHHDYVPRDLGIGGGDDVQLDYCLDCGQIQGRFPLPPAGMEGPPRD